MAFQKMEATPPHSNLPALPFEFEEPELPHAEFAARYEPLVMKGPSMEPTLYAGEVAIIDLDDTAPSPPGLFAVYQVGGGIEVMQIEVIPRIKGPRTAIVSYRNKTFGTYEVPVEKLNVCGRVVGLIKKC